LKGAVSNEEKKMGEVSTTVAHAVGSLLHLGVKRDEDVGGHPTYKVVARVRGFGWTVSAVRFGRFVELVGTLQQQKTVVECGLIPAEEFPRQFKRQLLGMRLSAEELEARAAALDRWFVELCRLVRERCTDRDTAGLGASAGLDLALFELVRFLRLAEVVEALVASGALVERGADEPRLPAPGTPVLKDSHDLDAVDRDVDVRRDRVNERLERFRANRKPRPGHQTKRRSLSLRPALPPPAAPQGGTPRPRDRVATPRSKSLDPPADATSATSSDTPVSDFFHEISRDLSIRLASFQPVA